MTRVSTCSAEPWIDEVRIRALLSEADREDPARIRETLARARQLRGLDLPEVAALAAVRSPELSAEMFEAAGEIKHRIYGRRVVLFAPLYISNACSNECCYCAFRAANRAVRRRTLSQEDIAREVAALERQGHKRVLLVASENPTSQGLDYVLESIRTVYATRSGPRGEIRRVNVNIAPLSVEGFRRLRAERIGTYQIFQETYHRATYAAVHCGGPKRDYLWRLTALDRAMEGGISDVGMGVLFGLYDWRFELLALLQHVRHLEDRFGVGPHTISVPRLEPAVGSDLAAHPPWPVSDDDFRRIVAILRLAVPYTGLIMSTRESPAMRRETLRLGISQISAGSRTDPGGYTAGAEVREADSSQFLIGDHRPLDEVVRDLATLGYLPSFCTACYRLGRVGEDFMDLARPGEIRNHCEPNAVSTFLEYLLDYASAETRRIGERLIAQAVDEMPPFVRQRTERLLARVRAGQRDVFC